MRCKYVNIELHNNNWSHNDAVIDCAIDRPHRIFGAQLYEWQWLQNLYSTQSLLLWTLVYTLRADKIQFSIWQDSTW